MKDSFSSKLFLNNDSNVLIYYVLIFYALFLIRQLKKAIKLLKQTKHLS